MAKLDIKYRKNSNRKIHLAYRDENECITISPLIFINLSSSNFHLDISFFSTRAIKDDLPFGFILFFFFQLILFFCPLVIIFILLEFALFTSLAGHFIWLILFFYILVEEALSCKYFRLFSEIWPKMLTNSRMLCHSLVDSEGL